MLQAEWEVNALKNLIWKSLSKYSMCFKFIWRSVSSKTCAYTPSDSRVPVDYGVLHIILVPVQAYIVHCTPLNSAIWVPTNTQNNPACKLSEVQVQLRVKLTSAQANKHDLIINVTKLNISNRTNKTEELAEKHSYGHNIFNYSKHNSLLPISLQKFHMLMIVMFHIYLIAWITYFLDFWQMIFNAFPAPHIIYKKKHQEASTVSSLASFKQRGQKILSRHNLYKDQQYDLDIAHRRNSSNQQTRLWKAMIIPQSLLRGKKNHYSLSIIVPHQLSPFMCDCKHSWSYRVRRNNKFIYIHRILQPPLESHTKLLRRRHHWMPSQIYKKGHTGNKDKMYKARCNIPQCRNITLKKHHHLYLLLQLISLKIASTAWPWISGWLF